MRAYKLKQVPFPKCAEDCELLPLFGAIECESICPWKFDPETGDPYEKEKICAQ